MTPTIAWPDYLPAVQLAGRGAQVVSPIRSARLASGRNRIERAFAAVPVEHPVTWLMTSLQADLFESWFKNTLIDGTLWFSMELTLPQGRGPWAFQFTDIYRGAEPIGPEATRRWRYTATLQQWLRPESAFPPWIGDFPDWIPFLGIFDRLMNDTWPEA